MTLQFKEKKNSVMQACEILVSVRLVQVLPSAVNNVQKYLGEDI